MRFSDANPQIETGLSA